MQIRQIANQPIGQVLRVAAVALGIVPEGKPTVPLDVKKEGLIAVVEPYRGVHAASLIARIHIARDHNTIMAIKSEVFTFLAQRIGESAARAAIAQVFEETVPMGLNGRASSLAKLTP